VGLTRSDRDVAAAVSLNIEAGKEKLMRPRLRLFLGAEEPEMATLPEPEVSIKLGELARILSDAMIWDRTWISDFAEDEIRISSDLFEVLSAYSHLRPSA